MHEGAESGRAYEPTKSSPFLPILACNHFVGGCSVDPVHYCSATERAHTYKLKEVGHTNNNQHSKQILDPTAETLCVQWIH